LNRLGAIKNLVEFFTLSHPLGELLKGDRFREVSNHRLLLGFCAQKPISHYLVDSGLALGGAYLVFSFFHGFPFLSGGSAPSIF
jgi:hypothetical protein